MHFQELQLWLTHQIQQHWAKAAGAIALTILSSWWALFWAWRKWRSRHDLDVLHISQTTIEKRPTGENGAIESWLILDVHSEDRIEDVISQSIPRRLIRHAAQRTTEANPFLSFAPEDRWYVLNIVRLAIAEPFRIGTAAKLHPQAKVGTIDCVFALTYERYKGMRQGKLRVILVEKALLEQPQALDGPLRFTSPQHSDRVTTLRKMHEDHRKGELSQYCMDVRLNIVL